MGMDVPCNGADGFRSSQCAHHLLQFLRTIDVIIYMRHMVVQRITISSLESIYEGLTCSLGTHNPLLCMDSDYGSFGAKEPIVLSGTPSPHPHEYE